MHFHSRRVLFRRLVVNLLFESVLLYGREMLSWLDDLRGLALSLLIILHGIGSEVFALLFVERQRNLESIFLHLLRVFFNYLVIQILRIPQPNLSW